MGAEVGEVVDAMTSAGCVDIKEAAEPAVGDQELGLVEVTVDGHHLVLFGVTRPQIGEQILDPASHRGEHRGEHVAAVLGAGEQVATGSAFGEVLGEAVQQCLDGGGRGDGGSTGAEELPQGLTGEARQDQDSLVCPPEAVRNGKVGGEGPVGVVERLNHARAQDLEVQATPATGGLDHGTPARPVGADAQVNLAPADPKVVEEGGHLVLVQGVGQPGQGWVGRPPPQGHPGRPVVDHGGAWRDAYAGGGHHRLGRRVTSRPSDVDPVLHHGRTPWGVGHLPRRPSLQLSAGDHGSRRQDPGGIFTQQEPKLGWPVVEVGVVRRLQARRMWPHGCQGAPCGWERPETTMRVFSPRRGVGSTAGPSARLGGWC